MKKRLLDFGGQDFLNISPIDLKQSILASEGRTIMAENVASEGCFLSGVTNAEIERAAGADLIMFNALDLLEPRIVGVPEGIKQEEQIGWIRKAVSRPIGINLEPVDYNAKMNENRSQISIGRIVSPKTLQLAQEYEFSFICLTGNPGTGVSNSAIKESIKMARKYYNGLIIAGKMHGAGVDEPVMNVDIAREFINEGIDILLVPAPYTVPYFTEKDLHDIVTIVKEFNKGKTIEEKVLVMTANGTSQDSSDTETIKKIGLASKACGADLQHIGDSFNGICLPENIYALGQAIRGKRHQLVMLSRSNIR
ncbi:MAG: hypothetical protein ACRCXA_12075 [Peptostreptococcaceae bacterium]